MLYEIAFPNVMFRGVFKTKEEINNIWIPKAIKEKSELYRSYYSVNQINLTEHLKTYKTLKSWKYPMLIDTIILDIDYDISHEHTKEKCIKVVNKLIDLGIQSINYQIYFSGRGFHIELANVFDFISPVEVRETLTTIVPEGDNIYDNARLIRVENTINNKTDLFKIPLYWQELTDNTDILELAKNPRLDYEILIAKNNNDLSHLKTSPPKEYNFKDTSNNNTILCVQTMYNNGPIPGSRHHILLRMVSSWRRSGLTKEQSYILAKSWIQDNIPDSELRNIVGNTYDKAYTYSCHDQLMMKYCDSKCIYFKNKNYLIDVKNSETMEKDFTAYIAKDFSTNSFDLADIYGCNSFRFYPGEFAVLIANTGSGKTSLMQNICLNINLKVLYLSLEVHQHLLFRKFIQIAHNMTKEEVINYYKENSNKLSDSLSNIYCMYSSPDLMSIRKLIAQIKPQLVVIDTIDGIEVDNYKDDNYKMGLIGKSLKEMAIQLDTIIFGVHHIGKEAAKTGDINVHSGKGSSTIEQKADKVLALIDNSKTEKILQSLKARDEAEIKFKLEIDWTTFRFKKITKFVNDKGEIK